MMLGATLVALLIRLLPAVGLEHVRTPVALALALIAGLGSLWMIWREIGGLQVVRT